MSGLGIETHLGAPRVLQVPELHVSVSNSDEIISIFCKRDRFNFARDFVRGDFNVVPPVPNVNDHVVLGTDWNDVLVPRWKCLKQFFQFNNIFLRINGWEIRRWAAI